MTATANTRFREGSTRLRTAILDAAQALFVSDGFEGTKMDTIAAQAAVSKRTVYDYYGDKQTLFSAVVERVMRSLEFAVQSALRDNLSDVYDLQRSLIGFARSITASALGSSEYNVLAQLLALDSARLPDAQRLWPAGDPEEALAARFAELDKAGLLKAPNPRRAADHFVALALSPAGPTAGLGRSATPTDAETENLILDGVRAFLRAYGPHSTWDA